MLNVVEPDEDESDVDEVSKPATTGTTTRELSCVLTDTEVRERGEEMAREKKEIERLEARRKSLNASIRAKSDRISELAKAINERVEVREVLCEWRPDYVNKRHDLIRTDSGKVLEQKTMSAADLQVRLPGVDRSTAEQREAAEDEAEDEVDAELVDDDDDDEPSFHSYGGIAVDGELYRDVGEAPLSYSDDEAKQVVSLESARTRATKPSTPKARKTAAKAKPQRSKGTQTKGRSKRKR